jgi:hypothetical protein
VIEELVSVWGFGLVVDIGCSFGGLDLDRSV